MAGESVANGTGAQPALAGVRVLELGRLIAAPLVAQILGDLGAEVVKVERAGEGDDFRRYGLVSMKDRDGNPTAESASFTSVNRNKRSITADLAHPEGQALVRDLARHADIFIENFKVGGLARYGLDYETLREVNPRLVYLSVTGFGQTGPYAPMAGSDGAFQAMSGLMSVTGEPGTEPVRVGTFAVDYVTGVYGALAAVTALRTRDATGKGQYIDLSLLDCGVAALAPRSCDYLVGGVVPGQMGNRTPGTAPGQPFRCADGYISVQAGSDRMFAVLCKVLDRPDIAADPRFADPKLRQLNIEPLVPLLEASFLQRTSKEWFDLLSGTGMITAPIYDIAQCFDDPQVQARELRVTVPHALGVPVDLVANPMRFSATPITEYRAPPTLGEGVADVLSSWLDYDDDKIAQLRAAGAI